MRSQLTRSVLHRILFNKPIPHGRYLSNHAAIRIPTRSSRAVVSIQQRRAYFFDMKEQRDLKGPYYLPGFLDMAEFSVAKRQERRLPDTAKLLKAFQKYLMAKENSKTVIEDLQLRKLAETFEYLRSLRQNGTVIQWTREDFERSRQCFSRLPENPGKEYLTFAEALFHEYHELVKQDVENSSLTADEANKLVFDYLTTVISVACATTSLRDAMSKYFGKTDALLLGKPEAELSDAQKRPLHRPLRCLLGNAQKQSQTKEIEEIATYIEERGYYMTLRMRLTMALHYTIIGDVDKARHWLSRIEGLETGDTGNTDLIIAILNASAKRQDRAIGNEVVSLLLKNGRVGKKLIWDATFLWTIATGKGIDEIERQRRVLLDRAKDEPGELQLDATTLNRMLEAANPTENPYLAERLIDLGRRWNIEPNVDTLIIQIKYRLHAKDFDGAKSVFEDLRSHQNLSIQNAEVSNQLVQAMHASGKYSRNEIMLIVEDVIDRRIPLEPKTTALLVRDHLEHDEMHDAIDLIGSYIYNYSMAGRDVVRSVVIDFIHDRSRSDDEAWDAYMIMYHAFDETPRALREDIMEEFFARRRSDLGMYIFMHIRHHSREDTRGDVGTYVRALLSAAIYGNPNIITQIHNQLKLDDRLDDAGPRLRNALMHAYTRAGDADTALRFWEETRRSQAGPNAMSIILALRACQAGAIDGVDTAVGIWQLLHSMKIEINEDMFASFVAAFTARGSFELAQKLLLTCEQSMGYKVSPRILGSFVNATIRRSYYAEAHEWASEHFPHVWEEMQRIGFVKIPGRSEREFKLKWKLDI